MDMEKVEVIDGRLSGKSDVKSSKVTHIRYGAS